MSTTLIAERFRDRPPFARLSDRVLAAWHGFQQRHDDRLALRRLWRQGPRLVGDAGLDPEALDAAFGGGWDDLRPNGLLQRASGRR